MRKKYVKPKLAAIQVYYEDSIAAASVTVRPGGSNNDFPLINE